jgi:hypothetical protein
MPIKGFRYKHADLGLNKIVTEFVDIYKNWQPYKIEMSTGTCDRYGTSIFEGDILRQITCEQTFKVEDIVSFLLMCGRYEEKHGTPIFDSLEIVKDER